MKDECNHGEYLATGIDRCKLCPKCNNMIVDMEETRKQTDRLIDSLHDKLNEPNIFQKLTRSFFDT